MEILTASLLFILGLILIVKGGDFFVDAASWFAEASGVPKFIIGATIVSVATTLPELIVSIMAAIEGSNGMAVGNAVGSVTANVGLIMGISIIAMHGPVKRSTVFIKALIMIGACALLLAFSSGLEFSIVGSVVLLVVFVGFIIENVYSASHSEEDDDDDDKPIVKDKKTLFINIAMFILGTLGIVFGSDLLVDNATFFAKLMGVSDAIIGVTIVAIGTSLPELVTTITAIVKKESSLSIGNIIGANIIDLTLIMPICSIVSGGSLPITKQSAILDIPACLVLLVMAMLPVLIKQKLFKYQGVAMICTYAAYLVLLGVFFL